MIAEHEPMTSPGPELHGVEDPDIHLRRLLADKFEEPWYKSFWRNVKEAIHPPKLPPLEVTSKPVPVQDIWGLYGGGGKRAGATSILIHGSVIALMLIVGTNKHVQQIVKEK